MKQVGENREQATVTLQRPMVKWQSHRSRVRAVAAIRSSQLRRMNAVGFKYHTKQMTNTFTHQLSLELVRAAPSWIPGLALDNGEFGLRDAVIGLSQALTEGGGAGLDESANDIWEIPMQIMWEAEPFCWHTHNRPSLCCAWSHMIYVIQISMECFSHSKRLHCNIPCCNMRVKCK
jgi:hypothetical protein